MMLHAATDGGHSETVHAAAPGDTIAVCGHPLTQVHDTEWPVDPEVGSCLRCQHAVAVLMQVSAV